MKDQPLSMSKIGTPLGLPDSHSKADLNANANFLRREITNSNITMNDPLTPKTPLFTFHNLGTFKQDVEEKKKMRNQIKEIKNSKPLMIAMFANPSSQNQIAPPIIVTAPSTDTTVRSQKVLESQTFDAKIPSVSHPVIKVNPT
jgi:hypothetical protein